MDAIKADAGDLEGIAGLLGYYSCRGVMTPRTREYLEERLREFYVCKRDGRVVGCCALHKVSSELAEVRCFAVKEEFMGEGFGRMLLDACLREAKDAGYRRVFTLTLEGEFFRKNKFTRMSKLKIPLQTFQGQPELNPIKLAGWMTLFLKMLVADSAHELNMESRTFTSPPRHLL